MLVVIALEMVAAGETRRARHEARWNALFLVGIGFWVLVLVGTLLGYL